MVAKALTYSRINNAKNFISDVADNNNSFYIALGKSDTWSDSLLDFTDDDNFPELINGATLTQAYEAQIRQGFLSMKKLTASLVSHGIRRYNWVSGTNYVAWDSNDPNIFTKQFYVVTDELKVYKCIIAGNGASTIKPTHTNNTPTTEGDGYTWRYMYSISALQATRFLSTVYIPVKTVLTSGISTEDDIQYANQLASSNIAGKIYRIKVINGGSGYTTATVNIDGNGTGAAATATISNGIITDITVTNNGSGYDVVKVTVTGDGSGAELEAVLSPQGGHGKDPVTELGGEFVIGSFNLIGDESGVFIVNDDFRQVSLLKNPLAFSTTNIATAETINATKTMRLSNVTGGENFINGGIGSVISDTNDTTIRAFVTAYDNGTGDLRYTQNDKTGYKNFIEGNSITSNNGASATIDTLAQDTPDVEIFSGNLLFTDNISPVVRTSIGEEQIIFIIQH